MSNLHASDGTEAASAPRIRPDASPVDLPSGFTAFVANIGIKDDTTDYSAVMSTVPAVSAAVFTQSRFAGPSVELSRRHLAGGRVNGFVVISKNANVANGPSGMDDATELASATATALGLESDRLLVASTGVIGRGYPMDKIRSFFGEFAARARAVATANPVAEAIMTTDTHAKIAVREIGDGRVVGIAKGVGMIEPNMATMLAFLMSDVMPVGPAGSSPPDLQDHFQAVVDRTFNSLSVDSDTSTSDTAALIANATRGTVSVDEFNAALEGVCLDLTRMLASDGEGAATLIEVTVTGAVDEAQARAVAKSIVNSPLVKTAVFGNDPNWGRIAMAVGKVEDDRIIGSQVTIRIGGKELFPTRCTDEELDRLSAYLARPQVDIEVDLGLGGSRWTVYGCDLSYGYVRINAEYTT